MSFRMFLLASRSCSVSSPVKHVGLREVIGYLNCLLHDRVNWSTCDQELQTLVFNFSRSIVHFINVR